MFRRKVPPAPCTASGIFRIRLSSCSTRTSYRASETHQTVKAASARCGPRTAQRVRLASRQSRPALARRWYLDSSLLRLPLVRPDCGTSGGSKTRSCRGRGVRSARVSQQLTPGVGGAETSCLEARTNGAQQVRAVCCKPGRRNFQYHLTRTEAGPLPDVCFRLWRDAMPDSCMTNPSMLVWSGLGVTFS